jgi:hypothetical protein
MIQTMTAPDRAETNRRNAQHSTGPKTVEGKNRSRFNALKHGLTARTPVLPGEDPEAHQARIDAFTAILEPRNELEQHLAEEAAQSSWQLDRARRAEAARVAYSLRHAPVEDELRQAEEAAALGRRLFWDPRGPLPLYPHFEYRPGEPRVSASGRADDPDDPARLVPRLEATAAGCRWLLDRWAGLRDLLERGLAWQSPDKLKAIRLLGKQPLDAADDPEVARIFLAADLLGSQEAQIFAELKGELLGGEAAVYQKRLTERRVVDDLTPPDEAAARAVLLGIVAKAMARLETLAAAHRARARADDAEQPARLAFDASIEGERMRRHQVSCGRALSRTLDTLLKIRRDADRRRSGPEAAEPAEAPASESVVATYHRVFFGSGDGQAEPGSDPIVEVPGGNGSDAAPCETDVPAPDAPLEDRGSCGVGRREEDPCTPHLAPRAPEPAPGLPSESASEDWHQPAQNEPTTAADGRRDPTVATPTAAPGPDPAVPQGNSEQPGPAAGRSDEPADPPSNPPATRDPAPKPAAPDGPEEGAGEDGADCLKADVPRPPKPPAAGLQDPPRAGPAPPLATSNPLTGRPPS